MRRLGGASVEHVRGCLVTQRVFMVLAGICGGVFVGCGGRTGPLGRQQQPGDGTGHDADRDGITHRTVSRNDPLDLFDGAWTDGRVPSLQFGIVASGSVQFAQLNVQLGPRHTRQGEEERECRHLVR